MTKKAFQSFAYTDKKTGLIVVVNEDDHYADDHPYVKERPDMFGDLEDMITVHQAPKKAPPVEAATAEPGEKRATRRA